MLTTAIGSATCRAANDVPHRSGKGSDFARPGWMEPSVFVMVSGPDIGASDQAELDAMLASTTFN